MMSGEYGAAKPGLRRSENDLAGHALPLNKVNALRLSQLVNNSQFAIITVRPQLKQGGQFLHLFHIKI